MISITEILKIQLEEQLLIKYGVINHLKLLRIQDMMDIDVGSPQQSANFFIKNSFCFHVQRHYAARARYENSASGSGIKNKNISIQVLAEELRKPIIRKFKKRKVHSPFIDNFWGTDLPDMQLISKFNREIHFFIMFY